MENTVPFDIRKFRKFKPEFLVEWNAPKISSRAFLPSTIELLRSNSLRSTERKLFYPSIPVIMRPTKDMVGYASGSKCSLIFYSHYTFFSFFFFFLSISNKQKGLQYQITIFTISNKLIVYNVVLIFFFFFFFLQSAMS